MVRGSLSLVVPITHQSKLGGGGKGMNGGSVCVSRPVTSVGKYGIWRGSFPLTPFNIPFIYWIINFNAVARKGTLKPDFLSERKSAFTLLGATQGPVLWRWMVREPFTTIVHPTLHPPFYEKPLSLFPFTFKNQNIYKWNKHPHPRFGYSWESSPLL